MMSIIRRVINKIRSKNESKICTLEVVGQQSAEFRSNTTLLSAIKKMDIDINYYCGGTCSCGTCYVEIIDGIENLSKISARENMVLGYEKSNSNHRLACQARIKGNTKIKIPQW